MLHSNVTCPLCLCLSLDFCVALFPVYCACFVVFLFIGSILLCVPFGRAHPQALIPSGFILGNESFKGLKGPTNFLEVPFIILCPHGGAIIMERIFTKNHGGQSVHQLYLSRSSIPKGPLKWPSLSFVMTLQYGGHDCFHYKVPFGG